MKAVGSMMDIILVMGSARKNPGSYLQLISTSLVIDSVERQITGGFHG